MKKPPVRSKTTSRPGTATGKKKHVRRTPLKRGPDTAASTWIQHQPNLRRNLIGSRVRFLRIQMEITQDRLGARLARHGIVMTQAMIAKIEAGKRAVFDFEAQALARALGVPIGALIP